MTEALDSAIAALRRMLSEQGPEFEFPADAIWGYLDGTDFSSLKKPPVIVKLRDLGYIQDTGGITNAVTPDRRSAPTTKYRFGPKLRPLGSQPKRDARSIPDDFVADCARILDIEKELAVRFCASLLAKPFLILTGLSGSGKTKVAQAFAHWITPARRPNDPFQLGHSLEGERATYVISDADRLGIEFTSDKGTKVLLPRAIIEQWADFIETNDVPKSIGAQDLRDRIKSAGGEFSRYLQNFETHYKHAAFALIEARRTEIAAKYYEVVPVGADWTSNENIIGYPDGLNPSRFVSTPALELIRHACEPTNAHIPHFLILDEMNLSHVERYFADVLSMMESDEPLRLYHADSNTPESWRETRPNDRIRPVIDALPKNLFIIGTVNVDETTYVFSPKVLDRANVIEFRVEAASLEKYLASPYVTDLSILDGRGADFGEDFVALASDKAVAVPETRKTFLSNELMLLFGILKAHDAEYGYRTAHEATRLVHYYTMLCGKTDPEAIRGAVDAVIAQKVLPKLHGSRSKLEGLLWALAWLCGVDHGDPPGDVFRGQLQNASEAQDEHKYGPEVVWNALKAKNPTDPAKAALYPLSYDKVMRMWRKLMRDQFVTFAEA